MSIIHWRRQLYVWITVSVYIDMYASSYCNGSNLRKTCLCQEDTGPTLSWKYSRKVNKLRSSGQKKEKCLPGKNAWRPELLTGAEWGSTHFQAKISHPDLYLSNNFYIRREINDLWSTQVYTFIFAGASVWYLQTIGKRWWQWRTRNKVSWTQCHVVPRAEGDVTTCDKSLSDSDSAHTYIPLQSRLEQGSQHAGEVLQQLNEGLGCLGGHWVVS